VTQEQAYSYTALEIKVNNPVDSKQTLVLCLSFSHKAISFNVYVTRDTPTAPT